MRGQVYTGPVADVGNGRTVGMEEPCNSLRVRILRMKRLIVLLTLPVVLAACGSVEMTVIIPLQPVKAATPADLGTIAQVGMGIDGVPIFADAPSVLQTGHLPALDLFGGPLKRLSLLLLLLATCSSTEPTAKPTDAVFLLAMQGGGPKAISPAAHRTLQPQPKPGRDRTGIAGRAGRSTTRPGSGSRDPWRHAGGTGKRAGGCWSTSRTISGEKHRPCTNTRDSYHGYL